VKVNVCNTILPVKVLENECQLMFCRAGRASHAGRAGHAGRASRAGHAGRASRASRARRGV